MQPDELGFAIGTCGVVRVAERKAIARQACWSRRSLLFAAEAAIEVLDKLASVEGLSRSGFPLDSTRGKSGASLGAESWWILSEDCGALVSEVDGLTLFTWSPALTEIEWSVGGKNVPQSVRRLWLSRDGGDSAGPVLQAGGETHLLWRGSGSVEIG